MTKFEKKSQNQWNGNGAPFAVRSNGNVPVHE